MNSGALFSPALRDLGGYNAVEVLRRHAARRRPTIPCRWSSIST